MGVLLDSDALIEVLRRREPFYRHAQELLTQSATLFLSAVSYYEVLRGIEISHAIAQKSRLRLLDSQLHVLPVDKAVGEEAARIYLFLRTQGRLLPDADLLIAATALVHNLSLASNNQRHYARIPALSLANWDV